jgi:hypothetical protein
VASEPIKFFPFFFFFFFFILALTKLQNSLSRLLEGDGQESSQVYVSTNDQGPLKWWLSFFFFCSLFLLFAEQLKQDGSRVHFRTKV